MLFQKSENSGKAVYCHIVYTSVARLEYCQGALDQRFPSVLFARGFQNSMGVRFHIKMIKTASRIPTKWRQTSVRNAGQGAAERKKT
jgi:hypothetical protein